MPFRRIQYSVPKGSSHPLYNYYVPIPRHHGRRNISAYTLACFSISKAADKYQFFFHSLCAFLRNWGKDDNINQASFTITLFSTLQNDTYFAYRKAKRGSKADFKDWFSWLPWRIIPTFNRDNERPGRRGHLYADDTSNQQGKEGEEGSCMRIPRLPKGSHFSKNPSRRPCKHPANGQLLFRSLREPSTASEETINMVDWTITLYANHDCGTQTSWSES